MNCMFNELHVQAQRHNRNTLFYLGISNIPVIWQTEPRPGRKAINTKNNER